MSVTLANVDATWVNPGSVTYDAGELRRADAAAFVQAGIVRTSDDALSVSVDGSDVVTVKVGNWVIPGNAQTGSGVWRGGIASDITGALEARDATYGRIDLVVVRQLDTDVVASHGAYTGRIEIIKGTPSATPGVPALPSMAVELARITVPASGGAAASVDLSHRTYAAAVGGEIVAPSASLLPTSAAKDQRGRALDTNAEYLFDGVAWNPKPFMQLDHHAGNFTVPNGSWTTVTNWSTVKMVGMISQGGGAWAVSRSGWYLLTVGLEYAANAAGRRGVRLVAGTGSVARNFANPTTGGGTGPTLAFPVYLNAGANVSVQAYQDSGGSLDIVGDGNLGTTFGVAFLGD